MRSASRRGADCCTAEAPLGTAAAWERSVGGAELLESLLDNVPDLVTRFDRHFRHLYVNRAIERITGRPRSDFIGRTNRELGEDPELVELWETWLGDVFRSGRPAGFEFERAPKSGASRQCFSVRLVPELGPDGLARTVMGYVSDITQRRLAERESRYREERYRALVESSNDVVWTWEPRSLGGKFDPALAFWERLTGQSGEQQLGLGWLEMVHPEDRERVEAEWEASMEQGRRFDAEYRVRASDGTWRHLSARCFPVFEHNRVREWIGTMSDVTDRKQVEEDLRRAKAEAEAANNAKDEFLAVLSHELRTPLTPVLTAAQLMETDRSLSGDLQEFVRMIRRNVQLEVKLIDDLLDLTRISRGKLELHPTTIDLHEKLLHVVDICRCEALEKEQTLALEFDGQPWLVHGDPARLQQILWNLLRNAIKFTPQRGAVTVRGEREGTTLRLWFHDTGIGIDPDDLPRIFKAFEQGGSDITRRFGGLGLGLTISRALVDLHGGTITAHSEGENRGSTFVLTLPLLTPRGSPGSLGTGRKRPRPLLSGLSVLLVEDHADTARIMHRFLSQHGGEVHVAGSLADARKASDRLDRLDLLLSDLGLPDGHGTELLGRLRSRHPEMVAVALSGFGMEDDLRRSHEAGFRVHLTKPIDVSRLEQVLDDVARDIRAASTPDD